MLDQILNIIKTQAMNVVTDHPEIPADQRQQVAQTTTEAVADGLKSQLSVSNLGNIANLFSGDVKSSSQMNPVMETIKNTIVNALTQKTGLSAGIANGIAASIVPSLFKAFSNKVNDPNDQGFNMESLLNTFKGTGSGNGATSGNLLSSIGKLFQ